MGQQEHSGCSRLHACFTCFHSTDLQAVPGSGVGLGPTPGKEEVATTKHLPLGSSLIQQAKERKRGLGDDRGEGHSQALALASRKEGERQCVQQGNCG